MAASFLKTKPYWPYLGVSLVVLLPLLWPGYILTLDMVFTPTMPLPTHLTSSYPFYAALHWLSLGIPSSILQKCILMAILFGSMAGMHRLLELLHSPQATRWGIAIASIFFGVNPFTYDRFMAGQYGVLLGYALLPWVIVSGLRLWRQPSTRQGVGLGLLVALVGVVSVHTLGLIAVIAVSGVLIIGVYKRQRLGSRPQALSIAAATSLLLSSYWLLPLLAGQGRTAIIIGHFSKADAIAFTTLGNNPAAQLLHALQLQGFWAEARQLFILPGQHTLFWPLALLLLWMLVAIGLYRLAKKQPAVAILAGLCILGGSLLALSGPLDWLGTFIPVAKGYREPQKFVALVALGYALCLPWGIEAVLARLAAWREAAYQGGLCVLLLFPLILTSPMAWGFAGQLQPRQYPADWYAMDRYLLADQSRYQVVFLPWHQYMSYDFSQRIIASPAPPFFAAPMIVSDDPELGGAIASTTTSQTMAIGKIVRQTSKNSQVATDLSRYNIKYILVAKEYDWKHYAFLDHQTDLVLERESATLKLYRNQAWREP